MTEVFYNKDGTAISDETYALAKVITTDSGIKKHFVLSDGRNLYDPTSIEPFYKNKKWKMLKVSTDKFDTYLRYLTTGRKVHLTRAERI